MQADTTPKVLLLLEGKEAELPDWYTSVAMSFKEGKKKSVSFAVVKEDGEKAARRFGLAAWSKCALWQVPCASSGRARWLCAARPSQEEAGPLGAPPLPRALERAASKAADSTAFDHAGVPKDEEVPKAGILIVAVVDGKGGGRYARFTGSELRAGGEPSPSPARRSPDPATPALTRR